MRPENTLPSFAAALGVGVNALEMDVGVTADGVVVVTHDRTVNPDITRDANGKWLKGERPPVHALTLVELRRFDVGRIDPGSRYARKFRDQEPADGARIPTLEEVVGLAARAGNEAVRFNIEVKISPEDPDATLAAEPFADVVIAELRRLGAASRAILQSFEWRVLQRAQATAPEITTSYLTSRQYWLDNLERARAGPSPWTAGYDIDDFDGCVPRLVQAAGGRIWSTYYRELDRRQLETAHRLGLGVLVWTVNEIRHMRKLIELGVDGIITDYPDRLRGVMSACGLELPAPTPVDP